MQMVKVALCVQLRMQQRMCRPLAERLGAPQQYYDQQQHSACANTPHLRKCTDMRKTSNVTEKLPKPSAKTQTMG
jgi:hypothetical protein